MPSTTCPTKPKIAPSFTFLERLRSGESLSVVAILSGIHWNVLGQYFFKVPVDKAELIDLGVKNEQGNST